MTITTATHRYRRSTAQMRPQEPFAAAWSALA
jgi:hypothetical protein